MTENGGSASEESGDGEQFEVIRTDHGIGTWIRSDEVVFADGIGVAHGHTLGLEGLETVFVLMVDVKGEDESGNVVIYRQHIAMAAAAARTLTELIEEQIDQMKADGTWASETVGGADLPD